jgi:hypothetical protein
VAGIEYESAGWVGPLGKGTVGESDARIGSPVEKPALKLARSDGPERQEESAEQERSGGQEDPAPREESPAQSEGEPAGREEDPAEGAVDGPSNRSDDQTSFIGRSWLWEWSDPYRPETLLMSGGEDSFLRGLGRLRSPRNTTSQLTVDPQSGSVRQIELYRGRMVGRPIPMTLKDYGPYLTRRSWRDAWVTSGKRGLSREAGTGMSAGTLKLELPVEVPKTIQKVIGRGKPNLRVSGSETITISGRSTWEVGRKANESGGQSIFPQLSLKQELAVNVSGEIGDKINVDIDQNSKESLANRIRINYRGYEDEIIQTLDLGNTNLSLPGAQFVSYNGRHQGLFGVKTNARLGDVDLTVITSKQEGQSESNRFVGSSTVRTSRISDVNYAARQFYFLGDPREWPFAVDLTSLQVFKDDRNALNNQQGDFPTVPAKAYVYEAEYMTIPTQPGSYPDSIIVQTSPLRKAEDFLTGDFDRLLPGTDYEVFYFYESCPTIKLNRVLGEGEILAVAYYDTTFGGNVGNTEVAEGDTLELRILKVPKLNLGTLEDGTYDPGAPFYPTIRYEMRNIYNLGAQDILPEGFDLTILPKSGTIYDDDLNGVPYVRLLGLDRLDLNGLSAFDAGGTGADGQLDVDQGSVFLGLGLLVFPDLRPFAPDEVDTLFWRPRFFPEGVHRGPDSELPYYPPLSGEDAIPEIYDKKNILQGQDTQYEMNVEFRSSLYGETIFLKGNILEGSETVIANGQRLEKGRDYRIDYDTGAVDLISDVARESAADITIDYSFKPLFALGQRTLLGFSTSYRPVDDHGFATTWIYESKGATERRPKLGEEPSLTVIGDVSGSLSRRPEVLTRLIDGLPLISTDSPSSINMSGELGMSFPNPNTEKHAYIEDFEGSRDDFMVDLSRLRWFYSSLPVTAPRDTMYKAELRWYNPRKERRVRADALQPELTSLEGDDSVEAFEVDIAPRAGRSDSWAGITQAVSKDGVDFSRKQYLEIWVNDAFQGEDDAAPVFYGDTFYNPDSARIYIDMGSISEDAYWSVNSPPNGQPDTEDQNGDFQLDDSEFLQEDTGLDGTFTDDEGSYVPDEDQTGAGSPEDPHGDDYDLDPDLDDRDWNKFLKINGIEDNDRLDTEDLNRDGQVDLLSNSYFEYCVNLADSKYLDTVVEDAGVRTGWRRYRIPVKAGVDTTIGSPSLESIQYVRIWFTGFSVRSRLQIAKLGFTGNRWATEGVFDSTGTALTQEELEATGEQFLVGVVNNKDDKSFYVPPFDPGEDNNIPRREQSLRVTYRNIKPGHEGRAFRAFDPAQDYTLYRELRFYVWGERDDPDVRFFTRLGDEKNYYEIETPMKSGWRQIDVELQDLTYLKNPDVPDSVIVGDRTYRVVGNPRFTQVRRIMMGIVNVGEFATDGELYFNDIRLSEVRKDIGVASRFNVQASLADFMNLSGSYEGQDEDFLGIGTNKGSGIDRKRVSVGGKLNAHTLMTPLRLTLPISFNFSQNTSVPKFRTGDDRELTEGEIGDERSISKSTGLSADLARSPSRNPWLRYSIDAMRANVQWRKSRNVTPVRADTTEVVSTRLRYDVSPPQKPVPVLPGLSLNFLPSNLSLSFGTTSETRTSYDKEAGYRTKDVTTKPATMQLDTGYRPVPSLTLNFGLTSQRDLMRKNPLDFLGGLNIGTEVTRKESIRTNFSPRLFWWMGNPSLNYSGSYNENHNPGLTTEQDRQAGETRRNVTNSRSLRSSLNLPLGRYMDLLGGAGSDTSSAVSPLTWARAFFGAVGQFGQVTLSRTVTDRSTYNGIYGVPDLRYKLGLSRDLGRESRPAPSGSERKSTAVRTEARTDGTLFKDYRVSIAYQRDESDDENTAGSTTDESVSWPDVKVDISSLEKKLGLGGRLDRLSAQVAYAGRRTENSLQGGRQTSIGESKDWRPLVSLNATWAGGLTTNFSSNRKSEVRTTKSAGVGQTRNLTNSSYSFNLQKTIKGGEGVTLPFGGGGRSFQKTININVNLLYTRSSSSRVLATGKEIIDADNDKFRATTRATYNFSSNMVGTLELGFDQSRNKKVGRTVRGIEVSASARLRF